MKKSVFLLFLMISSVCWADSTKDVVGTAVAEKVCLYSVKFCDWTSTNKENGTISSKQYYFQGELGDTLMFDWKTSSEENCDKLVVTVDGVNILTKSGERHGTQKYAIPTSGGHVVEFVYAKDFYSSVGDDEVSVSNIEVCVWGVSNKKQYGLLYQRDKDQWGNKVGGTLTNNISVDSDNGGIFYLSYSFHNEEKHESSISVKLDGKTVLQDEMKGCYWLDNPIYRSFSVDLTAGTHNIIIVTKGHYTESSYYSYSHDCQVYAGASFVENTNEQSHQSLNIDDNKMLVIDYSSTINELEFTRKFNNSKWQSFYVPFSMSYDDWKDDFEVAKINDINMYDTDGDGEIDESELEIIMVKAGTLKPNHPYLIKAKTPGEKTIRLTDAILYAKKDSVEVSSAEMKFTFVGTCEGVSGEEMVNNKYYAMAGGALAYTEDTDVSLKPYRWYMKAESRGNQVILPSANNSRIRVKVFGEDGTETGIEELETEDTISENNAVYSLDGRLAGKNGTNGLRPGIYISNGKKVLVK